MHPTIVATTAPLEADKKQDIKHKTNNTASTDFWAVFWASNTLAKRHIQDNPATGPNTIEWFVKPEKDPEPISSKVSFRTNRLIPKK